MNPINLPEICVYDSLNYQPINPLVFPPSVFQFSILPTFHYSNLPSFQSSKLPFFQLSTIPIFHLSNLPNFHHSNLLFLQLSNTFKETEPVLIKPLPLLNPLTSVRRSCSRLPTGRCLLHRLHRGFVCLYKYPYWPRNLYAPMKPACFP
jgi:hypothetical protein